jgi:endonuclease YncB( thermonuclease family)
MGDRMPAVGRPRGSAWRALHTEGIVWEGQALIVGEETDLATRLIVTHQRLAFARGGAIALDVERGWLRPPPALNDDGTILLLVTLPDERNPEPIRLRVTEGRRAAAHLVSLLSGTGVRPVSRSLPLYVADTGEEPTGFPRARPVRVEPARPPEPATALPSLATLDADDFPPFATSALPPEFAPADQPPSPSARMLPSPATTSAEVVRHHDWNLLPVDGMRPRSTRQARRGWVIRLSGLVLLIALAAYGVSRLSDESGREIASRLPGVSLETPDPLASAPTPTAAPTGTATKPAATATAVLSVAEAPTEVPTRGTVEAQETAISIGVGGAAPTAETRPEPSPTDTVPPTNTPTTEPSPTHEPTETTAPSPTDPPTPTETIQPTETTESTPIPTPDPTDTAVPTGTAIPTDTVAPTETTEPAATATPTEKPTQTPKPTRTPKSSPTPTPTPTSIVRAQNPSLGSDELAQQVVVGGDFRYTVESAVRGVELPELALPNPGNGEWVVLVVSALNWSDENAEMSMEAFRLAPAGSPGQAVPLDSTTDAVASFLGFIPAFKHDDAALFAPGESHRLALVFLVSPGLGDLMLLAGPSSLDLALSFAHPAEITDLGEPPTPPELLRGKVTKVIDGRTIEVDVRGELVDVVYLGVTVPTGDACYAAQATAANSDLIAGKTVWLERERKNRASRSAVSRDVWFEGTDGTRLLIAAELAARGAATPSPVEPDVRFAGAISAAATAAQSSGLGFWSACGGPPPIEPAG